MATITEDYVSFETAKLLKEKGFDGLAHYAYDDKGMLWSKTYNAEESNIGIYDAPTLQMAMKWLREIKNICISVDIKIGGREYYIAISDIRSGLSFGALEDEICVTYEEACEAAIKYCLENLI